MLGSLGAYHAAEGFVTSALASRQSGFHNRIQVASVMSFSLEGGAETRGLQPCQNLDAKICPRPQLSELARAGPCLAAVLSENSWQVNSAK